MERVVYAQRDFGYSKLLGQLLFSTPIQLDRR